MALVLLLAVSLTCAVPAFAATGSDTIAIKVRVFDVKRGAAYEVGSDTATKGSSGIQSEPYTIPALSQFTKGTCDRVLKVVGSWYFPISDRAPGSVVSFSNNTSTATVTYWVENYTPPKAEQSTPGTSTEPTVTTPTVTTGEVALTVKVVYVDYADEIVGYGDAKALTLKCQSSYCKHNANCSIKLKEFHPTTLGLGETITQDGAAYEWIGWSKYTADATPQLATFYSWSSNTTNVTTPKGATFYLIYKNSDEPADTVTPIDTTTMTVSGSESWSYVDAMAIMDYLSGDEPLTDNAQLVADRNSDGAITYLDAMTIMDELQAE